MAKRPRRPSAKGPRLRVHRAAPSSPPGSKQPGASKPAKAARPGKPLVALSLDELESVAAVRELFWSNVMREMLVSLATAANDKNGPQVFDGRLAVVTSLGERIPIADVKPVMNFGVNDAGLGRQLSAMLQCTVFQIRTPGGEVYTLPVHEIRGFHSMSEELMQRVESSAPSPEAEGEQPFGFAAFTSLARGIRDTPLPQAPSEPGE
jgi:hypothetical protein